MCGELDVSPNAPYLKVIRDGLENTLNEQDFIEFMRLLSELGNSHRALMQLNLLKYEEFFKEFVIIYGNFILNYPNHDDIDILSKKVLFIKSLLRDM